MRDGDGANSNVVGEKLCKHKYSSYPYCYGEIASETQGNNYDDRINVFILTAKKKKCRNVCR